MVLEIYKRLIICNIGKERRRAGDVQRRTPRRNGKRGPWGSPQGIIINIGHRRWQYRQRRLKQARAMATWSDVRSRLGSWARIRWAERLKLGGYPYLSARTPPRSLFLKLKDQWPDPSYSVDYTTVPTSFQKIEVNEIEIQTAETIKTLDKQEKGWKE